VIARLERRMVRIALLALLALMACNDPRPEQVFVWVDTFEDVCDDDLPCGWARLSGDPNDARYVTSTFLSGEHSLMLSGDASVRGPGQGSTFAAFNFSSLELRVIGRCDMGAGIDVLVGLAETDGFDVGTGRVDMTMPATVFPPASWAETPSSTLVTAETGFIDGGLAPPPGSGGLFLRVTSVVLSMNGPGTCEIGEVLIGDAGSAMRTLDDGC
jgi:hypothetical protein